MNLLLSVWPAYKAVAGIDLGMAGMIMGASCLIGDTLQIFFGPLGVRYGPKRFLLFALFLACPIALIYSGGGNTIGIGCAFCLLYVAVGATYPNSALSGLMLKPRTPGKMVSLVMSAGYLGYALGPFAMRLSTYFNGSKALFLAPLGFIFLLGLLYRSPAKLQGNRKSRTSIKSLAPYWRPLSLLWFSQFALQGVTLSILFFIPEFLSSKHLPASMSLGWGHFVVIFSSTLSTFFGRSLADRPHPFRLIGGGGLLGALAVFSLVSFPMSVWGVLIFLSLIGGVIGLLIPLNVALGCRLAPGKEGAVSGLLMGGAWGMGGLVPFLAGHIATMEGVGSLSAALLFVGAFFLIPCVAAVALPFIIRLQPSKSDSPQPIRVGSRAPFPMILIDWEEDWEVNSEVFDVDNLIWDTDEEKEVPELTELVSTRSLNRFRKGTSKGKIRVRGMGRPALNQFVKFSPKKKAK